jgi:hypothetical protein
LSLIFVSTLASGVCFADGNYYEWPVTDRCEAEARQAAKVGASLLYPTFEPNDLRVSKGPAQLNPNAGKSTFWIPVSPKIEAETAKGSGFYGYMQVDVSYEPNSKTEAGGCTITKMTFRK